MVLNPGTIFTFRITGDSRCSFSKMLPNTFGFATTSIYQRSLTDLIFLRPIMERWLLVITVRQKSHPCLMCLIVDTSGLKKMIFRQTDVSDRVDTCDLCNWKKAAVFMISRTCFGINAIWIPLLNLETKY